jgi:hypothetical protein
MYRPLPVFALVAQIALMRISPRDGRDAISIAVRLRLP